MQMAIAQKRWTLEELHALPEDGNKYEVIHGALFVTPAPTYNHESILARLHAILAPYVASEELGLIFRPHAVVRRSDSEVEPDLQVVALNRNADRTWETAPIPILVVEAFSPSTFRVDRKEKRELYLEVGVPVYWMIDGKRRVVIVVRSGREDEIVDHEMEWHPAGASVPLTFRIAALFE